MGKGQAVITLLIVAVLVVGLLFLFPQIFRNGNNVGPPVVFRNDIITLENFDISNLRPIQGGSITVSFDLTNNGDKKVDKVKIDFSESTNVRRGSFNFVECGLLSDSPILGAISKNQKCEIKGLESLESRKVKATYQVGSDFSQNIVVKVSYPYQGSREAIIPIIDDKTVRTPPVHFTQSLPSYGPFVVDIIPPTKGWAIKDQPFEMKFKLKYIGSAATGIPTTVIDELKIEKRKFTIELSGLKKLSDKSCQFQSAQVDNTDSPMVNVDKDILVNKEYNCNLQALVKNDIFGYQTGKITASFSYTFEFQKSQSINVVKAV